MLNLHNNTTAQRFVCGLLWLLILAQSACTTMGATRQKLATDKSPVEVGDTVRVWASDQDIYEFKVAAITLNSISGASIEVQLEDIVRVDVQEKHGWRTTDMTVGSILGAQLVFVNGYALASVASTTGAGR
jgi:hypothetical protein